MGAPDHHDAYAAVAEVRSGEARLDLEEIEALARGARRLAPKGDAWDLAEAHNYDVRVDPGLPESCPGLLLQRARPHRRGLIVVRARRYRLALTLALLHELAHAFLFAYSHTHADVWLLTFALAVAEEDCTGTPQEIAARSAVPVWVARIRQEILASLGDEETGQDVR